MSWETPSESIDCDVDRLTHPNVGELSLLEIRCDPNVERDKNHDSLRLCCELPHGSRQPRDPTVRGCPDLRPRQICIGRRLLSLRLSKLGLSVFPLRLENVDLPFGYHLGSLSRGERRGRRLKFRRRLLSPLHGSRA